MATLQSQGVVGMQLCQRGDGAEVRLQWQLGDGVVEARLRETVRGVEILLSGSEHQPLLQRVADILAAQRGTQAFELDGVEVDTQGDPNAQRRRPGSDPNDEEPQRRRHGNGRRRAPVENAGHPLLPGGVGASYCR